jgi:uncharacterized protein DUF6132
MDMTTTILKKAFPVALGASIGFAYWYFIGCTSGHCPITSTWTTSTLYGAVVGASFLIGGKKKEPTVQESNLD